MPGCPGSCRLAAHDGGGRRRFSGPDAADFSISAAHALGCAIAVNQERPERRWGRQGHAALAAGVAAQDGDYSGLGFTQGGAKFRRGLTAQLQGTVD